MRRGITTLGLLCLVVCILLPSTTWAQGTTSRITGTITDKTGAVIAGASVTAKNEGTNISYTTTSSQTGVYVFDSLQVGTYTITAESQGFKKFFPAETSSASVCQRRSMPHLKSAQLANK